MGGALPSWLAGSTSLADAVARLRAEQAKSVSPGLWKRLSLVSSFDPSLYEVLSQGLEAPAFDQLAKWATVQTVPEGLALADATRNDPQFRWTSGDSELASTAAVLATHFRKADNADQAFLFAAIADPADGLREFRDAYTVADTKFDLSRCAELLELLRSHYFLLNPKLQDFHNDREQYLKSRILFADDYYRTVIYVERPELDRARSLAQENGPRRLNIYGKGGLGKTMLVHRLIAHEFIPEASGLRIPVARIDLDFANLPALSTQPWLVLLESAIQFQPQMTGSPFRSLIGAEELLLARQLRRGVAAVRQADVKSLTVSSNSSEAKIDSLFRQGIAEAAVLIVIDTIEELQLHYPDGLANLLRKLMTAQNSCKNLRILFSGRFPLLDDKHPLGLASDRPHGLTGEELRDLTIETVQIRKFGDEQARDYLTLMRHLPEGDVVEAIIRRSDGNPFELSLFAALAQGRPLLTKEDVENCPDAKLAYLVERVIDRIPCEDLTNDDTDEEKSRKMVNKAVLWVLRYAVIPRDLTRDYLDNVLGQYVIAESAGGGRDYTQLPGIYADRDRWPREVGIKDVLDRVWNALESYASSYSWISESAGVLHLQPEVTQPMRELLRANRAKYPLFDHMHESSWLYFEGRNDFAEAVYHRFEVEGEKAAATWHDYLERAYESGPRVTLQLADALLKKNIAEDGTQTSLISDAVFEATVRKTAAFAGLATWLLESTRKTDKLPAPVAGGGNLLDAAAALKVGDNARVRELLTEHWIGELREGNEQAAACLLLARVLPRSEGALIDRLHSRAIDLSRSGKAAWFPLYNVLGHAARRASVRSGTKGIEWYDEAVGCATEVRAEPAAIGQLLLEFGDVASAHGEWGRVAARADKIGLAEIGSPAREEAWGWILQHAIQFGDMERARWVARVGEGPARQERQADLTAAEYRGVDAEPFFEAAERGYEEQGHRLSKLQVQLKHARMLLEQVGNVNRAESVHRSIGADHLTDHVQAAEYWRLRYELEQRGRTYTAVSRALMEQRRKLVSLTPAWDAIFAATLAGAADTATDPHQLLRYVEQIDFAPGRLTTLLPLADAKFAAGKTAIEQWRNIGHPPREEGAFLRMLGFLAGCRFFGDAERWDDAGRDALLYSAGNPYLLVRVVPLLSSRTKLTLPAGDAAQEPVWWFLSLAAAEFAMESGDPDGVRERLEMLDKAPPVPRLHCGTWRRGALRARVAEAEGRPAEAAAHFQDALAIAGELGDHRAIRDMQAPRPTPPRGPTVSFSPVPSGVLPAGMPTEADALFDLPEIAIVVRDGTLQTRGKPVATSLANLLAADPLAVYSPAMVEIASAHPAPEQLEHEVQFIFRGIPEFFTLPRAELKVSGPALNAVPWELAAKPTQQMTRSAFESYVIEIPPTPPGPVRVMVLQADSERERYTKRGYGLRGLRVADFYAKAGAKVDTVSIDDESWMFRMQSMEPNVVHISSGFWDSQQPREALLDMSGDGSDPVSGATLAGVLERFGHLLRRPVVILDVVWDERDAARQVFLRNSFASELWESSPIRAILGTGSYEGVDSGQTERALEMIASAVTGGATLVELHSELRAKTKPFLPPALFTDHPDARIV